MNLPEPMPYIPPHEAKNGNLSWPVDAARAAQTFQFVSVSDLKYRAPEFIVDNLIERETLCLIFGDPGCGKSFVAVDLALSVASGTAFHGRSVRQGSVFLIAGEGHNGLTRRFAAWSKAQGVSLAGVPMFKSERAAQFMDATSAAAVTAAVQNLALQYGTPALIVIDTLARNFGAGDENNTKDMSEFVAALDDLKGRFPDSAVLVVHHSGHAVKDRARGAMALKGAVDLEYRIEKEGDTLTMVNTKAKDMEPPANLSFRLAIVDLGDGVSSAVLAECTAPERKERMNRGLRLALETYQDAAVETGIWDAGAFRGVALESWRPFFYAKHTGDNDGTKRQAFNRARTELQAAKLMAVTEDVYLVQHNQTIEKILDRRSKTASVTKRDNA